MKRPDDLVKTTATFSYVVNQFHNISNFFKVLWILVGDKRLLNMANMSLISKVMIKNAEACTKSRRRNKHLQVHNVTREDDE